MSADQTARHICIDAFQLDYVLPSHLEYYFQSYAKQNRSRAVNSFVQAMEKQNLVRRFTLPAMRGKRGGSSSKVVALAQVGAQLVAEELAIPFSKVRFKPLSRETNLWFLSHTLEIADYVFCLRYATQESGHTVNWIGEAELKRANPITITLSIETQKGQETTVQERPYRLIPDGVYSIQAPDKDGEEGRLTHALFELDRGTTTLSSQSPLQKQGLKHKIVAYEEFMRLGLYKTLFSMKAPPRITWVTTSEKRLEGIRNTVEEVVDEKFLNLFWFTTQELATPDAVLSKPIWSVAGRDELNVLFKGADA